MNDKNPEDCTMNDGSKLAHSVCSGDWVMRFGKHKGRSLDDIADYEPGYIVWLADNNVLPIEREFLDACRMDETQDDALREALFDTLHGSWGDRD